VKIPRTFLVGGDVHTVTFGDCDGNIAELEYETGKIRIDPAQNRDVAERVDSFWHEYLHAASMAYKLRLRHETIIKVAAALAEFFVENGYTIEEKYGRGTGRRHGSSS
jgi:hypothetical protein